MAHTLPQLPYAFDALEPHIDAQTMQIHHGKHHQAYVNNLNAALDKQPDLHQKSLEDLLGATYALDREAMATLLVFAVAAILLAPAIAALWTVWQKIAAPSPPEPIVLSVVGAGALAVNLSCALVLARFRTSSGSLTKAAFLSARNDAYANLAIIAAGVVTAFTQSIWPDVIVGLGIAAMNATAAREVWQAARAEGEATRGSGAATR